MTKTDNKNNQYQSIASALPDLVFILTESGYYADVLGGNVPELYHDARGLIGTSMYDVLPRAMADRFVNRIRQTLSSDKLTIFEYCLSAESVKGVDVLTGPAGRQWFEGRITPLKERYRGERAVVWVARNVTKWHDLEEQLRYLSEIDELTKIYNRRKLFEVLAERFYDFNRYRIPAYFLLIDIDQFKTINDHYGHSVGDYAIRHLSQVCGAQLRNTDILGRLGGDEFAVILPCSTEAASIALAERLLKAVRDTPCMVNETAVPLSISVGISTFAADDCGAEDVYNRADQAMYRSKNQGRNRINISELVNGHQNDGPLTGHRQLSGRGGR